MKYELKEHSFGSTIGQGFNLYFDNFIFLILVSIIANIPMLLLIYLIQIIKMQNPEIIMALTGATVLLQMIISVFITGIIILVISKKYLNEDSSPGKYISDILPMIFPIIGLALLQGLGVAFGTLLLIIPGIILVIGWSLSTQVLVIEKSGITEALSRSWALTKGDKWPIFGLFLVVGIILLIVQLAWSFFVTTITFDPVLMQILNQLIQIVFGPVFSCVLVVLYFNMRIKKEGFNIEHLANQFQITQPADQ